MEPDPKKQSKSYNFTKTFLNNVEPSADGKVINLYDEKIRGLTIRINKSGTKTFYLYRKVKHCPERITIDRFPDLTVEMDRKKAEELNADIALGGRSCWT